MQDAQLISQAGQVESLASDGLVSVSTGAGQPQKNMELAKFADSLGSSVPLQQTTEQVTMTGLYARTSDGKMVELTKESVASVMAGLMGNPLGYQPRLTAADDLNNVKSGMYYTGGTENPKNCPAVYNNCIIQYNNSFSGGRTQILFSTDARQTFVRTFNSIEWAPWTRIDNFGFNSIETLSSGVAGMLSKSYVNNLNEELINGSCGMYSGDTTNRPPTADTYGVWYTHKATYASGSGLFLIQVAMPQNGTEVWMRICWNNNWKEWKKLG